jgi:hypothetical protein
MSFILKFKLLIAIYILFGIQLLNICSAKEASIDPGIVEYARMYNVSITEAETRNAKVSYIAKLRNKMEVESPGTFAGLYIEHEPAFRVVVRFVGDARTQVEKYTQDPLFVPQTAPRSLEVLLAAQADIADQLVKNKIDFMSRIDLKKSEVTLFVKDPIKVGNQFSLALKVSPFIRILKTRGFIEPTAAISGGRRVESADDKYTTGFNVYDSNRELGIITAGHADDVLTYVPTSTQLDFQSELNTGNYDVQWHKQHITQSITPKQQTNKIELIQAPVPSLEITSITPSSGLPVGTPVCKSGINGYFKCGVVVDPNALSTWNGVVGSYIQVHHPQNEALALSGDSGGPVFGIGNKSAYGIIHGRGARGTSYRNDMFFMGIEGVADLGVTVLTEPFEITSIPDASGPNGVIEIPVNFKGVPRFPVAVTIEPVTCPPPWECFPASGEFTTNQPSPFMVGWSCQADEGVPTTTFIIKTTLKDASLIQPPSVEHNLTCIASLAPKSRTNRPTGRAGGVILDQPRPRH